MADPIKSPVRKSNFTRKLVIAEQVILYTAIVAGIGFYAGHNYAQAQSSKTAAAIHDAVKAATTPAPVAQASK